MTVRDLGYRAYEGELRPASHNTWVLLRYGLWRIWGSWLTKLGVFTAFLPLLGMALLAMVRFATVGREMPEVPAEAPGFAQWFFSSEAAVWLRSLTAAQFWFFVSVVTLRSGAGVIAEDFTYRAYQFYFAKPVTPVQYLVGRCAALAIFVFALVFVPTSLLTLVLAAVGPEAQLLERMGLLLPALLDATIIAVSCSTLSVAVSALSKSRALTFTAWVVLLVVPFLLAMIVRRITDWEWAYSVSLPGLLWVIGDALFKVRESWAVLSWYHAGPILAALTAGSVYLALHRIRQAEVIT
jgi:ABC-2 type transport system permease protein